MKRKEYTGLLREEGGEEDWLLLDHYSNSLKSIRLAEILEEDLSNHYVSVRYFICDKPCSLEEAEESFLKTLNGMVETHVGAHYSEITGYLWTDEEINIGGHDLIAELRSYTDKWLILLVDIEDKPKMIV